MGYCKIFYEPLKGGEAKSEILFDGVMYSSIPLPRGVVFLACLAADITVINNARMFHRGCRSDCSAPEATG